MPIEYCVFGGEHYLLHTRVLHVACLLSKTAHQMVQRLFKMLYQETSGLHEAAFLLAGFALFAKLLALVRDRLLAYSFGANIDLDIYYAAFRIPDFIYVSLASLVASAVLIPFIIERFERNKKDTYKFFNSVFTVFFVAITAVSGLVFFAMPFLSKIIAPGLGYEAQSELVILSRIMLLSPIFLGLSGLFASITQTLRCFIVYAIAPVLYNIGIIIGIVALYPFLGLSGLAYGVVLGAFFHMLIQLPVLFRNGFIPRISLPLWSDIREVVLLSFPRTIALSANQFVVLVFIAIASLMTEGSIAIFNFSFSLQSVPLSIIGVSYSIAAFPTLTRLFSSGEQDKFVEQVIVAVRHIIFWSVPLLVLFIVLRAQIVRTVLGTGEFDWADTRLTAAALALFVISVVAQSLILLFVRGYYAAGHTKKPLFINLFSSGLIIVVAFFLVKAFTAYDFFRYFMESLFRIEGLPGGEIIMLPLAFSLGVLVNVMVLWIFFKKDFNMSSQRITKTLKESFYAAITMGFVAHQALRVFDNVFDINTFVGIFSQGFLSGLLGIIAGVILLRILKNKEIEDVWRTLHHRFWRRRPIAPDQNEL